MADARWKTPSVVLYGRNQVDIRKGSKEIHLNTFPESPAGYRDALEYAQRVATAAGLAFRNQIKGDI